MQLSTAVKLPRSHRAVYPNRCVRCNGDPAGNTVRLLTHTIGWWTFVFLTFGWFFSTKVPACKSCRIWIRTQRVGRWLIVLALSFAFMWLVWPYVKDFISIPFRHWVAVAMLLVCASPYILWEIFFPPCIDITAYRDSVDYEFQSPDYAYEFADLNQDANWVKIS